MKWARNHGYERIAQARMRAAAEALGLEVREVPLPLGYALGDELTALVGREPVADGDLRWHISVNGGDRLPTWHELVEAAHQIRPGVCFVLGVPPRSWWMADIPSGRFVLHLWELRDPNLEESWLAQRTPGGRAPS